MTPDTPLALVGNALAVQVAALERARRGLRTLAVSCGGAWGGYFAGVEVGGRCRDAGMVLHEFHSPRTPEAAPPLAGYDPLRRYDAARFGAAVRQWVARHHPTRDIDPPQMWTAGRALPDLVLANGLEALPGLRCAGAVREQLRVITLAPGPWHARHKLGWPAGVGYDRASRLNHGDALHEALVAPFARKVLGGDAGTLPASYHRVPWLPLYWPETLLAALEGRPHALPPTVFSRPAGAEVADLCAGLAAHMQASPLVDARHDRVLRVEPEARGFALTLEHGGRVHAARLGWALAPRQGLAACGIASEAAAEARVPLLLVFLQFDAAARSRRFSVMHTPDGDTGCYRVCDASAMGGDGDRAPLRLVLEAHPAVFERHHGPVPDDAAVQRAALADLRRIGAVAPGCAPTLVRVLRLPGALRLPSAAGLEAFEAQRAELLRRLPGVELLAAAAGPFTSGLADQIVQGLRLAAQDDALPAAA